jgi:hypothetical protein
VIKNGPAIALMSESMTAKPSTTYRIRLRSIGSDDNEIRRLRMMLKSMLRRFRFRVIELEQEQAANENSCVSRNQVGASPAKPRKQL